MWAAKEFSGSSAALEACAGCSSSWAEAQQPLGARIFPSVQDHICQTLQGSCRLHPEPNPSLCYAGNSSTCKPQPVGNVCSVNWGVLNTQLKNQVLERSKSLRQGWSAPRLTFPAGHSHGAVTLVGQPLVQFSLFRIEELCSSPFSSFFSPPAASPGLWTWAWGLPGLLMVPGQKNWCKPGPKPSSTLASLLLRFAHLPGWGFGLSYLPGVFWSSAEMKGTYINID